MNYLDVKKKYAGYSIVQKGYKDSIPFTMLSGVNDTTEIKGIEVHDKPFTSIDITHCVFSGKKKPNKSYKGTVYAWYK